MTDEIRHAYRRTFEGPLGGTVLVDLMEHCGFLASHDGNPFDEGRRDMVLHILDMYGASNIVDVVQAIQAIPNKQREKQDEALFYTEDYAAHR